MKQGFLKKVLIFALFGLLLLANTFVVSAKNREIVTEQNQLYSEFSSDEAVISHPPALLAQQSSGDELLDTQPESAEFFENTPSDPEETFQENPGDSQIKEHSTPIHLNQSDVLEEEESDNRADLAPWIIAAALLVASITLVLIIKTIVANSAQNHY